MALRVALTPDYLSYDTGVYTIRVPAGTQIETVISPIYLSAADYVQSGFSIKGAPPEWLDMNAKCWRTRTGGRPEFFCMTSSNTFVLTPDNGLDRSANLVLSLILMPSHSSTTIDDEFANRWFDGIVAAAKSLLLASPAEWGNPELANHYQVKFKEYVGEAKRYIRTGLRHPQADGINHVKLHY